jgi:hypothetical protein
MALKADFVSWLSWACFSNTALYFVAQVALMEEFDGLMSASNELLDFDWFVLKTSPLKQHNVYMNILSWNP